ncbi:MAG: AbrB/MazE/SpoVT family DNA-binding domain-containing protein [Nevskia sp.]|jgi:antitoxin component of MazEF toxin-antitoxin module|nr:AbrB/MazE/SpoVT family DNA-binding domain-containing protein [Nevskia sp.]
MNTKVAMWGNSNAVRLPASLASETGLTEGAEVRLVKTERGILIERRRQRATLAELLSNTPADAEVAGWDQNGRLGSELL